VFDFLQDPYHVVACFPGAALTEDLGGDAYRATVKVKVGPVTAAYTGTATVQRRDRVERVAALVAVGRGARGTGTASATATMRVTPGPAGATVLLSTDLTIAGKLAQFGRGMMADVSNRMVGELAARVRERVEADAPATPAADLAPVRLSSVVRAVVAGFRRRLRQRLRVSRSTT
jgi:carbon monoxide dehydrogenase subunit G